MAGFAPPWERISEVDGRRLTGLSHWAPGPAAAVVCAWEPATSEAEKERCWSVWSRRVQAAMQHLNWPQPRLFRRFAGADEVWCAEAPIDRLYAAVALVEELARGSDLDAAIAAAADEDDAVGDPKMLAWQDWASKHGLPFMWCDDAVSVGHGVRSMMWRRDELPQRPDPALADRLGSVPTALITGTNGKTTTSRLLARILQVDGHNVGATGTDGLVVAGDVIDAGDWTGPGGARAILRHTDVEVAVLEAARGGMLRRGLGLVDVDVAAVTNVSNDHLGEWGIDTVADMAVVKLLVARAVRPEGRFVCYDDGGPLITCLTKHPPTASILRYVDRSRDAATEGAPGTVAAWVEEAATPTLVVDCGALDAHGRVRPPLRVAADQVPMTVGGAARYNVANALCAALLARGMGASDEAIAAGLASLNPDPLDSPGRSNLLSLNGARVLLDFGHNPDGLLRVAEFASRLDVTRRLVVLGQAGDRTDPEIAGLVESMLSCRPDRWFLKSMPEYARGREPGEVVAVLRDALQRAGVADHKISDHLSEATTVQAALAELRAGDLLLLFIQADAAGILRLLERAGATTGWSA